MMSVGLHCRLARPGFAAGLAEFMDFVISHKRDVWVCTREQIADHWFKHHPPIAALPPEMTTTPKNKKGKGPDEVKEQEIRQSWTGPKSAEKVEEKEESEVDEADGDII